MIAIDTSILPNAVWDKMKPIEHPIKRQPKKEAIRGIYKSMKEAVKNVKWYKRPFKATMRMAKDEYYKMIENEQWYNNTLYSASVERHRNDELDLEVIHISFKRHDRKTDENISWQHKQWIKNDLCGAEAEGLELFPAESRLLNTANQYHIWVLGDNRKLPFGFDDGRAVVETTKKMDSGAVQTYQENKK